MEATWMSIVDEWIRKLRYIYTMEYYLAIKKDIWVRSNEGDETGADYTEWSKAERKTPIQYTNTYIRASNVMLKILQARLQQYMNRELPDIQAGFRKGRGTSDQIANIHWIIKKAREFQKNIYLCFTDYAKAFDCVDKYKLWKILKEMGIQITWPASWEICMQVMNQQLELDMEQQTGSK